MFRRHVFASASRSFVTSRLWSSNNALSQALARQYSASSKKTGSGSKKISKKDEDEVDGTSNERESLSSSSAAAAAAAASSSSSSSSSSATSPRSFELCDAAARGDVARVTSLLESLDQSNEDLPTLFDGRTPLHVAARAGQYAVLQALLSSAAASAVVNAEDDAHRTPLDDAAASHNRTCVRLLRAHGGKLLATNALDLLTASARGDTTAVAVLLDAGIDPNSQWSAGDRTALHVAAAEGHVAVCRLLVDAGADVNAIDADGSRPMDDAARRKNRAVYTLLRAAGGQVSTYSRERLAVEVLASVARGDLSAVQRFADAGVHFDAVFDYEHRTALHIAAANGHFSLATYLLDQGCNPSVKDRLGRTPLDDALDSGSTELVRLLKSRGGRLGGGGVGDGAEAEPHARSIATHDTRMIDAAASGNLSLVEQLIAAGTSVNVVDYDRRTPLHLAASEGHVDVSRALIAAGADVNAVDRFGNAPLQDAKRQRSPMHREVANLLLASGAVSSEDFYLRRNTEEFTQSLSRSLGILAERGAWTYAEAWVTNAADDELLLSEAYFVAPRREAKRAANLLRDKAAIDLAVPVSDRHELESDAEAAERTHGFLRDVYRTRNARWISDVNQVHFGHRRDEALSAAKMRSGVVVPVILTSGSRSSDKSVAAAAAAAAAAAGGAATGDETSAMAAASAHRSNEHVLAVLVFFSPEARLRDDALLSQYETIAAGLIASGMSDLSKSSFRTAAKAAVEAARRHMVEEAAAGGGQGGGAFGSFDMSEFISHDWDEASAAASAAELTEDAESYGSQVGLEHEGSRPRMATMEAVAEKAARAGEAADKEAMRAASTSGASDESQSMSKEALMNVVFNRLREKGVFAANVIYEEIDWFFNHLHFNPQYYTLFSVEQIAQHVQLFIAARKLAQARGAPEDIFLEVDHDEGFLLICPANWRSIDATETKLEALISRLPASVTYSITSFCSKGKAVARGTQQLELYVFRRCHYLVPPTQASVAAEQKASEHTKEADGNPQAPSSPAEETRDAMADRLASEADIYMLATEEFLRDKDDFVIQRYQDLLAASVHKLSPTLQFNLYEGESGDPLAPGVVEKAHLMCCFRTNHSYLSTLSEVLEANGLRTERKYIDTFANGMTVYSVYVAPTTSLEARLNRVLTEMSLIHTLPRDDVLTPLFLAKSLSAQEYAYALAVSRALYYFLTRKSDEFLILASAFAHDPVNLSRLEALNKKMRTAAATPARIASCFADNVDIVKALFTDFRASAANPEHKPMQNATLATRVRKRATKELDADILLQAINFNALCKKTNFFAKRKSSLSFRLDGAMTSGSAVRDQPYAVFFVIGPDFQGFHVRFRDISRGGIRLIASSNMQAFVRNQETQFQETYNLAWTQNKKNKDIPEFGSKGTVLLTFPDGPATMYGKKLAFQKYVAGLLDLIIPRHKSDLVDHYGQEELLFLGPDEGTADWMRWAAEYARYRRYPYWKSFTTGKPASMGGIPHDVYGMTTRSVHRFKLNALERLGLKEESCTKVQTGGPDGDLGSNEVTISKDRTIAIVDGSGVLYDPEGIDREALTELAHQRLMIVNFPAARLSSGGFRVLATDRDVRLPSGEMVENGLVFRNEFHLHPLCTADMFVPCGGRPESVNLANMHRMLDENGTPKFKVIVEGANLFFTPEARSFMEDHGVVHIKDAAANKGGVTSSSLEVLAALALTDDEFDKHMRVHDKKKVPQFYTEYVTEIQQRLERNADLEFECVWREHQARKGLVKFHVIIDEVSDKINSLTDYIHASALYEDLEVRNAVLRAALPKTLQRLVDLHLVQERIPEIYLRAVFSTHLASRYVYMHGLHQMEIAFFMYMKNILAAGEDSAAAFDRMVDAKPQTTAKDA